MCQHQDMIMRHTVVRGLQINFGNVALVNGSIGHHSIIRYGRNIK